MSLDYPSAVLRPPFRRAFRLPFRSPAGIETIIANALADINADDLVGVASVSEIPNSGLGGTGFDYDSVLGTPANGKPHPPGALLLFGSFGDFVNTPASAATKVTGDIEFIFRVNPDDNTPSVAEYIIATRKDNSSRAYQIRLNTDGTLILFTSPDGSTTVTGTSTAANGVPNGTAWWGKITLDVNDGAGNRVYNFSISIQQTTDEDAVTFSQLGDTVTTSGTTSIFASDSPIEIGSVLGGSGSQFSGSILRAIVKNGIDGPVAADMNAADQTNAANVDGSTFVSSGAVGETWTQRGDTPIQNTGHKALASKGSYGLETTAGQDIAVFTRFIVGRFTTAAPGANQVIFDARSNALKSVSLFSDFSNSNKLTLDAGGTPIAIGGAYDNDLHVFTVVSNGANSLLRVSGVGEIAGNPGSEVLDYGTILADLSIGNSAPFSYNRDLTFNSALSGARIAQVEDALAQTYKGVQV